MLPYIVPKSHTYTGLRNAIGVAAAQGGGTILLEAADYVDDGSGTVVIKNDNIHILGVGGSKIVAPTIGDVDILSSQPFLFNNVLLTQDVNKYDNVLNVASTFYFKPRGFVLINLTVVPNVVVLSQICYIKAIDGNQLHISPFLPFGIKQTDTYTIQPITLLNNISISNVTFEGKNTTNLVRGLRLNGLTNSKFDHLTFMNFNGAAGAFIDLG